MIGRELELDAAARFLDSLGTGSRVLVVTGEPGIGKTTVWRAAYDAAVDRGIRVLACRPAQAEAKLSYSGLTDLLADCEEALERIPDPQRAALRVALLRSAAQAVPPEPRVVYAGLASVLGVLTEETPALVAVDDVQWLDRPSSAAVAFALRRATGTRVGFLLAQRTDDDSALPDALACALQDVDTEQLTLGPLSIGALHAVIVDAVGRAPPRPVLIRLAETSRGNPFYALEIARELERHGVPSAGEGLPIPADLSDLVASRISRLSPATQEALLTVAALASPARDRFETEALEPAEKAGLIQFQGDRIVFAHPLFASAVYASASPGRLRQLHRRLADEVGEPEQRAWHLALATTVPDEAIATELALAAVQARTRGSPAAASELLELAVRLTPPGNERLRDDRALAAAEHAFHAGDLTRSRTLAEDVLAHATDGQRRGHALRVLGQIRYHGSSFDEAVPLLEEALGLITDDSSVVELNVNLAYAYVNLGEVTAAVPHALAAVDHAERVGDDSVIAVALAVSVIVRFFAGEPLDRAALARALELESPEHQVVMPMRPSLVAGIVLHIADELERSEAYLLALHELTHQRGEDGDLPLLATQIAMLLRNRGRAEEALEYLAEGYDAAQLVGSDTGLVLVLAERCGSRGLLGDEVGARADAEEARRLAAESAYWFGSMWASWCLAYLELSRADYDAASAAMAPVAAQVLGSGACDPISASFLPEAIEALIGTGELAQATSLIEILQNHADLHGTASALSAAARCRALLLAACGEVDRAAELSDLALAHAPSELPLHVGRALLTKGQIERRRRRKRAGREALEQAAAVFDALGATLWAQRARVELERTGRRHVGGDALTPTERHVAELAVRGLTNRQIAEAAFLSPKTVEANLTRTYRKLGIHRRVELGHALAAHERALTK